MCENVAYTLSIFSGIGELDYRLKITEAMSLKLCKLFDLGDVW